MINTDRLDTLYNSPLSSLFQELADAIQQRNIRDAAECIKEVDLQISSLTPDERQLYSDFEGAFMTLVRSSTPSRTH